MATEKKAEYPILPFPSQEDWRLWLEANHTNVDGIWMQFFKKGSGIPSVVYAEALDEALCFGWIDGQLKRGDDQYYLQKFTPRRKRSLWSKRNIEHVARLEAAGKIHASGWNAIAEAKANGRWDSAYDSHSNAMPPDDLMEELAKSPESLAFFESLNKVNKFSIIWRLQSAIKPEIREKRFKQILEMMSKGEKFHP